MNLEYIAVRKGNKCVDIDCIVDSDGKPMVDKKSGKPVVVVGVYEVEE